MLQEMQRLFPMVHFSIQGWYKHNTTGVMSFLCSEGGDGRALEQVARALDPPAEPAVALTLQEWIGVPRVRIDVTSTLSLRKRLGLQLHL